MDINHLQGNDVAIQVHACRRLYEADSDSRIIVEQELRRARQKENRRARDYVWECAAAMIPDWARGYLVMDGEWDAKPGKTEELKLRITNCAEITVLMVEDHGVYRVRENGFSVPYPSPAIGLYGEPPTVIWQDHNILSYYTGDCSLAIGAAAERWELAVRMLADVNRLRAAWVPKKEEDEVQEEGYGEEEEKEGSDE